MRSGAGTGEGSALVTGASRGIGREIALRLAAAGWPVAVNYRAARSEAEAVVAEIEANGGRAVALQADVSVPGDAAGLVARSEDALGPLAITVNNAGITRDRLLLQMSEDDWDAIWMTDLAGPRALAHAAVKRMSLRGAGRLVNVASVVGVSGNAGQANYAAAKSALLGLTRELAISCGASGITVNAVVPGYIVTDATAHLNDQQRRQWLTRIPLGRFAEPSEAAEIVVFLCGESAGYVTGQCIAVDGGFLAAQGSGLAS
jgi:3-oxoacyl-[acyl-carrier protein] reductase